MRHRDGLLEVRAVLDGGVSEETNPMNDLSGGSRGRR
jgi:hypothetical protein